MRVSIHKLNDKWFAVPELRVDMFFGIARPNDIHIEKNGILIDNQDQVFEEGMIATGYSFADRFIIESFEE